MKTVEEIKAAIEAAVPGAAVEFVQNPSPSAQHSLRLAPASAVAVATFLRDDAELAFDFLSNASGVDWPDKEIAEKVKVMRQVVKTVDGVEQTVDETVEEIRKHTEPGYLEAVYHLYSVEKKDGPLVIRMRTANRSDQTELPSLTPVWRAAHAIQPKASVPCSGRVEHAIHGSFGRHRYRCVLHLQFDQNFEGV